MQEVRLMKQQSIFSVTTALALVMAAGVAQAGFQWVPRPEAEQPVVVDVPVVEIVPVQEMEPEIDLVQEPAFVETMPQDAKPLPPAMEPTERPVAHEDLPPWLVKEAPALPVQAEEVVAVPVMEKDPMQVAEPVLEGFGKDMPLVIAMRQIVPADYQFAFGSGVNMGTAITWQGGKPWRDVLCDVLDPMGLVMRIDGKVVYVEQAAKTEGVFAAAVKARVAEQESMEHTAPVMVEAPLFEMDEPLPAPSAMDVAVVETVEEPAMDVQPISFRPLPIAQEVQEDMKPQPKWVVEAGRTLREVMEDWAQQADWVVVWRSERDYLIESGATFAGSFEKAAEEVLQAFAHAEPPVRATFYRNKTLVIDADALNDLN